MAKNDSKLLKIGVFYDGNYFAIVSNYYRYNHERKQRISIGGLHDFIRRHVAEKELTDYSFCQVVDAHYFRGRKSAADADRENKLYYERLFEDILMREGVVTHYTPLSPTGEKGIDVWLALEAFELAIYKKFDVLVLIACDSDFIPLVRKINTLGTRVMVLGWDFSYTDEFENERITTTSLELLKEVTYPVKMHNIIDEKLNKHDPIISNLFVKERERPEYEPRNPAITQYSTVSAADRTDFDPRNVIMTPGGREQNGYIQNLNFEKGYGFITPQNGTANLYFHASNVINNQFNELMLNETVEFIVGQNEKGPCAINVRKLNY